MAEINTTANVATRLGISQRLVQRLVKELGIEPERAGKSQVLSARDIKKIAARNTKRGPKGKKK